MDQLDHQIAMRPSKATRTHPDGTTIESMRPNLFVVNDRCRAAIAVLLVFLMLYLQLYRLSVLFYEFPSQHRHKLNPIIL
jgi:hypothetical protein